MKLFTKADGTLPDLPPVQEKPPVIGNLSTVKRHEQFGGAIALGLSEALETLIVGLNEAKEQSLRDNGYTNLVGKHWDDFNVNKIGKKFLYLDSGGSGCFLVELKTGELYNIKGYGVADYNKKKKANLGNVFQVDPAWLLSKRWNYLRG